MANANKPFGLSPVGKLGASDYDGRGNVYSIPTSDATSTYRIGDLVRLNGSGDTFGIPGIVKTVTNDGATLGQGAVGVIIGLGTNRYGPFIDPNNLNTLVVPVTKAVVYYALVADDPNLIFEIQEANSGTALTAAAIGLNCNLTITANQTGSAPLSSTVLDNATEVVTIGLDVRLLGLVQSPDNAFGLAARWRVMINSHAYRAGITGF
jgi:hypothetical protein